MMKNQFVPLLAIFFSLHVSLYAQPFQRHHFKLDAAALLRKEYAGAYEFRISPKASLEFQFGQQRYDKGAEDLFPGMLTVEYTQFQIDTFYNQWPYTQINIPEKVFIGESRPLPQIPKYVPAASRRFELGYRFSYQRDSSKIRFFLQPGLCLIHHDYYEVVQTLDLQHKSVQTRYDGFAPKIRIDQVTTTYRQTQQMTQQTRWVPGLAYDAGLAIWDGGHGSLEGRAGLLWFPQLPYIQELSVYPLRQLQPRFSIHLCITLGKLRQ